MIPPLKHRQLKAQMALKAISVSSLAKRAGLSMTTTSQILNGRLRDPLKFARLHALVERAKLPTETLTH